jgi:hypothetical protein
MSVQQIEDGRGSGRTISVTDGGAARTEPAGSSVATADHTVQPGSSMQIAAGRVGRRQISIKNLSAANPVFIALDNPPATVTGHLRIEPGGVYSFPPGVSYEGPIEAISSDGPAVIVVMEFYAATAP